MKLAVRACFVYQVDGLVGQMAVVDVFGTCVYGIFYDSFVVFDIMVFFVLAF